MIIVHPSTAKQIESLHKELPQALLLTGAQGVGLLTIARELAGEHLTLILQPMSKKDELDSENGTIPVAAIRNLYENTRSKYTTSQVVIIDDADRLSLGAQAAFLKLLEEPNHQVHFILTSHLPEKLLPTIRSRLQVLTVLPITTSQSSEFIEKLGMIDSKVKARLEFIASGLPAEIRRLTKDESYFNERASIMTDARDMLLGDNYQQLLIIQKYQSDRTKAQRLVEGMILIARRVLSQKPQPALIKQLEKLLDIKTNLDTNHNVRLQLGRYVL